MLDHKLTSAGHLTGEDLTGDQYMDVLNEYSYIWGVDKEKYVLLKDEFGTSILSIDEKEIMFLLIEDDIVADSVIAKMLEHGNKVYNSITELKEAINIR